MMIEHSAYWELWWSNYVHVSWTKCATSIHIYLFFYRIFKLTLVFKRTLMYMLVFIDLVLKQD